MLIGSIACIESFNVPGDGRGTPEAAKVNKWRKKIEKICS